MRRLWNQPRSLCLAGAGALVSIAGLGAALTETEVMESWLRPAAIVPVKDQRVLKNTLAGKEYEVRFAVENRSGHTIRLVGGYFGQCGPYSCRMVDGPPVEIRAHSVGIFKTTYRPTVPGVDENDLIIYTDDPDTPQLKVRLTAHIQGANEVKGATPHR